MSLLYLGSTLLTTNTQSPNLSLVIPDETTFCLLHISDYDYSMTWHVTSISLDGQEGVEEVRHVQTTNLQRAGIYSFTGFSTGTKSFTLTRDYAISAGASYSFLFFSGQHPTSPIKNKRYTTKEGSGPAVISINEIESGSDCIILAFVSGYSSTPSMNVNGQTSIFSNVYYGTRYGVALKQGTNTLSNIIAENCQYAYLDALIIQPASTISQISISDSGTGLDSASKTEKHELNIYYRIKASIKPYNKITGELHKV